MLNGCTYTCRNEDCAAHKKELWLNPSWPIGNRVDVQRSEAVRVQPDFVEHLEKSDRPYALIQLPNHGEVKQVGWRFYLYCQDCCVIWEEDVANVGEESVVANLVPRSCQRCGRHLKTSTEMFRDATEVPCPHCSQPLEPRAWYVQGEL